MKYKELLKSKGWVSTTCGVCTGTMKNNWTNKDFPGVVIEELYTRNLFRYKEHGRAKFGGSLDSLQHQHFMQ